MMDMHSNIKDFQKLVSSIPNVGLDWHRKTILDHARDTANFITKNIKELKLPEGKDHSHAIVVSAGPGLHKNGSLKKIKEFNYKGVIIAVDGSLLHCLRTGVIPDFVLSLDPHPTRIVRWFGDPNFATHSKVDDYFTRQDLDIELRKKNIEGHLKDIDLVNQYAPKLKLLLSTTTSQNVESRTREAKFDRYWWNPLMDNPKEEGLTRELYKINKAPCVNTGGNVGTAAWVFATSIFKIPTIAMVGMDFGYQKSTPYTLTQTYKELLDTTGMSAEDDLSFLFPEFKNPLTLETCYTDPTYYWYRSNFFDLYKNSSSKTINCTESGILHGEGLECKYLDDFLSEVADG